MPSRILSGCEQPGCPNRSDCADHTKRAKVCVVWGPPGSGKTTFVRKHMAKGDLFFDFDLIMAAITGLPLYEDVPGAIAFVMNMRDGFMDAAMYSKFTGRIWIISSTPIEKDRRYLEKDLNAEVFIMDAPQSVCVERTSSRGPQWKAIVSKWFVKRQLQFPDEQETA
jgi:hypothetical protein